MEEIKTVIIVEGGNVQSVLSNFTDLQVIIFDIDNLKAEGKTRKQIDVLLKNMNNRLKSIY